MSTCLAVATTPGLESDVKFEASCRVVPCLRSISSNLCEVCLWHLTRHLSIISIFLNGKQNCQNFNLVELLCKPSYCVYLSLRRMTFKICSDLVIYTDVSPLPSSVFFSFATSIVYLISHSQYTVLSSFFVSVIYLTTFFFYCYHNRKIVS